LFSIGISALAEVLAGRSLDLAPQVVSLHAGIALSRGDGGVAQQLVERAHIWPGAASTGDVYTGAVQEITAFAA
jgi:hypothetical protein